MMQLSNDMYHNPIKEMMHQVHYLYNIIVMCMSFALIHPSVACGHMLNLWPHRAGLSLYHLALSDI